MKLSIIIPCYNEAGTIGDVVSRVIQAPLPEGWSKEIIVVDDGSNQETQDAVHTLASDIVRTIFSQKNGGKGAAVKEGMRHATGDYLVIQDADLEYNPDEYRLLLSPVITGEARSVFGSRIKVSNNVSFSHIYFYGGLLVAKVFNAVFGSSFSDITTCYKLFPRVLIPELLTQTSNDFVFDAVELTRVIARHGNVVEVPITYRARSREEGKKLNWVHGVRSVIAIFALRIGMPLETALRITRFLISGVSAAVVNVGTLYILVEYIQLWYLAAAIISFMVAFVASFLANKFWTFNSRSVEGVHKQFGLHLMVAIVNLGINTALVYLFVDVMHIWYILAQILATAIIAFESYFAFRWIYRQVSI